jgi:hypothetical protein
MGLSARDTGFAAVRTLLMLRGLSVLYFHQRNAPPKFTIRGMTFSENQFPLFRIMP